MILLIASGIWLGALLLAVTLASAASRPTPAIPSSGPPDSESLEDVKQPLADTRGLTNPAALRSA